MELLLSLISKYAAIFNNSQYIKNVIILLLIVKLRKNHRKGSSWYKSHVLLPLTSEQPEASPNRREQAVKIKLNAEVYTMTYIVVK